MITRSAALRVAAFGRSLLTTRVTVWPLAVNNLVYAASGASVNPAVAAAALGVPSAEWKLTKTMFAACEERIEAKPQTSTANVFIRWHWATAYKVSQRAMGVKAQPPTFCQFVPVFVQSSGRGMMRVCAKMDRGKSVPAFAGAGHRTAGGNAV